MQHNITYKTRKEKYMCHMNISAYEQVSIMREIQKKTPSGFNSSKTVQGGLF